MIQIGLTGWTDHDSIAPDSKRKLIDYASHFPVVEMDTSFYAIPSERNIHNWVETTPERFQFIPKAYGPLTTHKRRSDETRTLKELFALYRKTFQPMMEKGKILSFLFQFPPYFTCEKKQVDYLRTVRQYMGDWPIAIEFRHKSWFNDELKESTLDFLKEMKFINVVVDQPQTPNNSIPFIPVATHPEKSFIRLHGRNYQGWLGDQTENWRAVRTLYDYGEEELEEIKETALELEQNSKEIAVIFNNNSGGHAAPNAKKLQKMMGLEDQGLAPRQLDLF